MKANDDGYERRELLAIARQYRRDGYKVVMPEKGAPLPPFLADHVPDLIAERDDDKVVVEIKRAVAVAGSNELVDLAEKVSGQPGWRLELIALRGLRTISLPDIHRVRLEVAKLSEAGFREAAFTVAFSAVENGLASVAALNGLNTANASLAKLIHALVVRGAISRDVAERAEDARKRRNALFHSTADQKINQTDVDALADLLETIVQPEGGAEAA